MPDVCMDCGDGHWECGDENDVCADAPAGSWTNLGVAQVPTGVGDLTVSVTVSAKIVDGSCQVRLLTGSPPDDILVRTLYRGEDAQVSTEPQEILVEAPRS